jgi:hypothetical protein
VQTLNFSQAIANPVFAFVSLNGNGYAFNRDFELLSLGGVDGNDCGYWGCGGASKVVVDLGGGISSTSSTATILAEPNLMVRFGSWEHSIRSRGAAASNEYWNGFTVGVQDTAVDFCTRQSDRARMHPQQCSGAWRPGPAGSRTCRSGHRTSTQALSGRRF